MNSRSKLSMMCALAGMFASFENPSYGRLEEQTKEDHSARIKEGNDAREKKRGIKKFNINGVEIPARNVKNARRKYNNLAVEKQ